MKFILVKKRRRNEKKRRYLYRLWSGDQILYIGKTTQDITTVLRRHFFGKSKRYKRIDVLLVTMIEVQHHMTFADCAIYQSYYVNFYKPPYNNGAFEKDYPTFNLQPYKWQEVHLKHIERWCQEKILINQHRTAQLKQRRHEWRQQQINEQLGKIPDTENSRTKE